MAAAAAEGAAVAAARNPLKIDVAWPLLEEKKNCFSHVGHFQNINVLMCFLNVFRRFGRFGRFGRLDFAR